MVAITAAQGWRGADLDLAAYLKRIGYDGDTRPTLPVLQALHRAHVLSIPFENLEIILGRPLHVDLDSVQTKLVAADRGGYCFEHTGLFAAVLERLGFGVDAMLARVSMGTDDLRPQTHAVLRVTAEDDDREWLADVGFGGGPLHPLELRDGAETEQEGRRFRVVRRIGDMDTPVWTVYLHGEEGWVDQHSSWEAPQYPVDFKVANHYVSTSPGSPFTRRPFAQRLSPQRLNVLDGTTWRVIHPGGRTEEQQVPQAEVPALLADVFGIHLSAADAEALRRWTPPQA
jgi:N-hydroxyarylamine O-acetyltransferase